MDKIFETVSFHLVKPCNMNCSYCYATYNTFGVKQQLKKHEVFIILTKLAEAGVQKVTFAGGEPMLYPHLDEAIIKAKELGMTTSIITNGSMIEEEWLEKMQSHLDWIGVSVDSANPATNFLIGRYTREGDRRRIIDYWTLITKIKRYNYKLKINTVVNHYNEADSMRNFIKWAKPDRWKVFDTLRVEGQNEKGFQKIRSTYFEQFVEYHSDIEVMVPESNALMTRSYLLIDPKGRFYENWGSENKKSDSLVDHSVEHCLGQIQLDRELFLERGGVYDW